MASKRVKSDLGLEELKQLRVELRKDRTDLAVQGGVVPSVYCERLKALAYRIDALDKAIWHLENPDKP